MASHDSITSHSTASPDTRPVKRQKVTRACDRCKNRKRRCDGELPCSVCHASHNHCTYNATYTRGRIVDPTPSARTQAEEAAAAADAAAAAAPPSPERNPAIARLISRATSPESEDVTAFEGQYIGPTSAYSFLKRAWERFGKQQQASSESERLENGTSRAASVFAYGDKRPRVVLGDGSKLPDREVTRRLLEHYFDYAMPTYRFLHRHSVANWLEMYHQGRLTSPTRQAIVLMVLATASLFLSVRGFARFDSDDDTLKDAEKYFHAARRIISEETGRVRLESVQSRLAMCLYLLHTSQPNQAWYTFGTTVQMLFALGLHRRQFHAASPPTQSERIVGECRKRAFWVAHTLDVYLSVMLGRPPLIHEEDIDQESPSNLDDDDLIRPTDPTSTHADKDTMINASIQHARIANIVKMAAREQFSTARRSGQHRIDLTAELNAEIAMWKASLPVILSGLVHTSSLMPVFRRQVVVLHLAHAHAVMFINRPLLLSDASIAPAAAPHVQACLTAAKDTLESLLRQSHDGTPFNAFWFTQYVTFNALSIVYVWLIQSLRGRLPAGNISFGNQELFQLAETIQKHLAQATDANAPSFRYSAVLAELQQEARRLVYHAARSSPALQHILIPQENTNGVTPNASMQAMMTPNMAGADTTPGGSLVDWELFGKDFPLDPALWMQLDAFPFSDIGYEEWTSPP